MAQVPNDELEKVLKELEQLQGEEDQIVLKKAKILLDMHNKWRTCRFTDKKLRFWDFWKFQQTFPWNKRYLIRLIHWAELHNEIEKQIQQRKLQGITNVESEGIARYFAGKSMDKAASMWIDLHLRLQHKPESKDVKELLQTNTSQKTNKRKITNDSSDSSPFVPTASDLKDQSTMDPFVIPKPSTLSNNNNDNQLAQTDQVVVDQVQHINDGQHQSSPLKKKSKAQPHKKSKKSDYSEDSFIDDEHHEPDEHINEEDTKAVKSVLELSHSSSECSILLNAAISLFLSNPSLVYDLISLEENMLHSNNKEWKATLDDFFNVLKSTFQKVEHNPQLLDILEDDM